MLGLGVANDRLDSGSSPQFALDGVGDAAPLAGDMDLELHVGRSVVAAIAAVGDDADQGRAGLRLDFGEYGRQRVTVVRFFRARPSHAR